MEEYTKMLRKKGISLDKFIGLRDKKSGNLPLYKVTYKGEISYLYSEEELEKFIKMKQEAEGRELEILEEDDTVEVEQEKEKAEGVIKYIEYHEGKEVEKTIRMIESYGLSIDEYFNGNSSKEPRYKLLSEIWKYMRIL